MVFRMGYNCKVGDLNMPVNLAFVPGRAGMQNMEIHAEKDHDGIPYNGDEFMQITEYDIPYHTGNRISITLGFNLGR